jgi:Reverse transcriptase (RNA-dependent DNA polymerase)
MVNPIVSPGEEAHPTRALASDTAPIQQLPPSHNPSDSLMIDLVNDHDLAHSTTPTASSHIDPPLQFLTNDCQQSPILDPWRSVLAQTGTQRLNRLYVVADGSCAGGSVVLALADNNLGRVPLSNARNPKTISEFRCELLASTIRQWTPNQWIASVPADLRCEILDHKRQKCSCQKRAPCTCGWERPYDASDERDLFVSLCQRPTYSIGPVFFHFAAAVLETGVLLLVCDQRNPGHCSYHVFDFGTAEYPCSMIIQSLFLPSQHGETHGIGHYETLGLPDTDPTIPHMTLFPRDHPILSALRHFSSQPAPSIGSSISYSCYHAPLLAPPLGSPPPPAAPASMPLSAPLPQPPTPPLLSTLSATKVHRKRLPSQRASESNSVYYPKKAKTSLVNTSIATPLTAPARTMSTPLTITATTSDLASALPSTYSEGQEAKQAPSPVPPPDPAVTATDVLDNVRHWVRQTACRGRLAARVHFSAIPMWTLRCRMVLLALAASLRSVPIDVTAIVTHLSVLWMLPREVFTIPSRGGAAAQRRKYNRIHRRLADDDLLSRLMSEVTSTSTPGTSGATAPPNMHPPSNGPARECTDVPASASDLSQRTIGSSLRPVPQLNPTSDRQARRAQHLFEHGHARRAMQSLSSVTSLADLSIAREREKLRCLHPPANGTLPDLPADAPEVVVDLDWMAAEMRASDNGASAGPSGYGSNYLSVLSADPHCVQALAFFVQQIVNHKLPEVLQTLLTTCIVVSIKKTSNGRRPIAIGDIFYRMAARYSQHRIAEPLNNKLRLCQYGTGHPDGCTLIVQSIQHLLRDPSCSIQQPIFRPMACLSVDIKNAFNTIDRAAILRALYSSPELSACWRTVAFGYGKPTQLLMRCEDSTPDSEAFIESRTGVRQGDPLAAYLFSLGIHPVYEELSRLTLHGCFAYIDDGHYVGSIAECWTVWERMAPLLRQLGLSVNEDKCELTCFNLHRVHYPSDRMALDQFRSTNIKINARTLKLLGCVIGVDDGVVAAELAADALLRRTRTTTFERIKQMKKQTGMLALQHLAGTTLNNTLRAMAPGATELWVRKYDVAVTAAAHSIIGIPTAAGDRYDEQLQASLAAGGFGLTSSRLLAPAAFLAGIESTMRHSPVFKAVWEGTSQLDPKSHMYLEINDALHTISHLETDLESRARPSSAEGLLLVPPSALPSSASSFVSHFKAQPPFPIQHAVSVRIATLSYNARVSEAGGVRRGGREHAARLRALRETDSALWLTVFPTEVALALTDLQWQWAARLRLGMDIPVICTVCPGCKKADVCLDSCWHALSCMQLSGVPITDRHNRILMIIARFCQLILLSVRTEPGGLDHGSKKRPDLQISLPDHTLLGDVTITHPSSRTHRDMASAKGAAAVGDASAARKNTKYDKLSSLTEMKFLPIVLYTYGGFHRSATKFIKCLVDSLDPATSLVSRLEFKQALKEHIAIALQRGNADVMIRASQRQRDSQLDGPLRTPAKHLFNYSDHLHGALPRRPLTVDGVVPMSAPVGDLA